MMQKLMYFVAAMILLISFLPFASTNLPVIVGSYHFWAMTWAILLLVFAPKVFSHHLMLLVIVLGAYLLLSLNTFCIDVDEWNKGVLWNDFYMMAVAVSIFCYFDVNKDYKGLAKISKFAVVLIAFTAVMTILVAMTDPYYSRTISATEEMKLEMLSSAELASLRRLQRFGAGARGDGFGFMILIPMAIYYLKTNLKLNFSKKWLWVLIVVCLFALLQMQFATLLLFGIALAAMALVPIKRRVITLSVITIIALIFINIPPITFANLFYDIASSLGNEENALATRMNAIGEYIEYGGGVIEHNAVSGRLDLRYVTSLQAFFDNPFFGRYFLTNLPMMDGGEEHLFIMNKLVTIGVIGFSFWFAVFYSFIKKQLSTLNKQYQYYFLVAIVGILAYGLFKVVIARQAWPLVFVVIPGFYYLPLLNKKNNRRKSSTIPPTHEMNDTLKSNQSFK